VTIEHVRLGGTGLRVSRLCLGTMNFGQLVAQADAFVLMDRALDLGIDFFDTANVYGGVRGEGVTEQIIGRWFQSGGRRERVVLATKVFGRMGDGPDESGLSALHVKSACEASLRRLRTDRIDLYQMHHVDRDTPFEETWRVLEELRREGKILYAGSSNFAALHIAQYGELARRRGGLGLASEQSLYNLTQRTIELEVIPACEAYGLGLLPWSPLAGGVLGGIRAEDQGRRASHDMQARTRKFRPQLEAFERLCAESGESPATMALAWLLAQKAVTAPIVGPRTVGQLDGSMRSLSVALSAETLARLDEIFPGPGGRAPEAYAW